MSYKDDQKQLKAPDEFQKLGAQALPWFETNGRTVLFAVVGVFVIFGVVAVVREISSRAETKATLGFGSALRVLNREVNAVPPAVPPAPDEAPFKSEQEKDEALVTKLTEFRKANDGKRAALSAALPLAQALLRQGKAAEAMPLLDEYIRSVESTDPLRPAALEARGYAFEAQNKYDDALAAFDQLAKENKSDFMKGMGLYHRARLLQLKGDNDGAAKQFAEIQSLAPESSASRLAKERIALLAASGVAIPSIAAPA
ncbi:MAG: tetratricopeptide repeat protein, partial [Archangium sp.]|nr:tetratricopeptide repeat protein [Archangium sp.]